MEGYGARSYLAYNGLLCVMLDNTSIKPWGDTKPNVIVLPKSPFYLYKPAATSHYWTGFNNPKTRMKIIYPIFCVLFYTLPTTIYHVSDCV